MITDRFGRYGPLLLMTLSEDHRKDKKVVKGASGERRL